MQSVPRRATSDTLKLLVIAVLSAAIAFLVACPGAILESGQFAADIHMEAVHVSNFADPTYKDTGNGFVYQITHNLDSGLGTPLLAVALIAIGYTLYRRRRADAVLALFALPYYILISIAAVRYARYTIPLLPVLALWVGCLLADMSRAKSISKRCVVTAGIAILFVWTAVDMVLLVRPMAQVDPRDMALSWLTPRISSAQQVGFAAMPWFGTPPFNPYFANYARGGWQRINTAAQSGLLKPSQILYHDDDWDMSVLAAHPAWVVLSEYDYRDALRLHNPQMMQFMTALNQNYRQSFVAPGDSWPAYKGDYGLPLHHLPHDMLYTNPEIVIYHRK